MQVEEKKERPKGSRGRARRKDGEEKPEREPARLAPGWLRGGVCLKSVLRGE